MFRTVRTAALVLSLSASLGAQQSSISLDEKKALVRQWIHMVWDAGDFAGFEQFAAPGYAYAAPGSGPLGRKALEAAVKDLKRDFPDNRNAIEGQVMDGDVVVTRGTTHRTDPTTGRAIEIPWMMWTRFAGGKIAEDWEVYTQPTSVQPISAVPNSEAQQGPAVSEKETSMSAKDIKAVIRRHVDAFSAGNDEEASPCLRPMCSITTPCRRPAKSVVGRT
jgi:ketosteroid isomerase-like protein